MNDVPTAECGSEYNRNNSAKVVLGSRTQLPTTDRFNSFSVSLPKIQIIRFRWVTAQENKSHSAAIVLQKSSGEKCLQNWRQIFGDVLGDEARPIMPCGGAVKPDGGGGGLEGRHGLGKKAARDPGQIHRPNPPWRAMAASPRLLTPSPPDPQPPYRGLSKPPPRRSTPLQRACGRVLLPNAVRRNATARLVPAYRDEAIGFGHFGRHGQRGARIRHRAA